MLPITCTIIAKNEADRIGRAIASVRDLVEDILVVDSGSTDDTVAIAQKLGARVVHNPWVGFGPQKRFAEDEARHDWILNLDADEWLSDELRSEIEAAFAAPPAATRAFRIRTRLVYPDAASPAPLADSHNYIRLYNRKVTRFRNSLTHDEVLSTDDVVQMRGEILHRSFRSVAHTMRKMLDYAELQHKENGAPRRIATLRLVIELPCQFFKYYLLRGHCFGGRAGFAYASTLAVSRFMRLLVVSGF